MSDWAEHKPKNKYDPFWYLPSGPDVFCIVIAVTIAAGIVLLCEWVS